MFKDRFCVPTEPNDLVVRLLKEGHCSNYSIHPGSDNLLKDLKKFYWWPGMKKDVANFVARCLTCQQVKAENHRPQGELQPLEIPEWK